MKRLIYILPILLAAVSCHKDALKDKGLLESRIQFSGLSVSSDVSTSSRGFLEANGLDVFGTRVKVFDWLSGFEGNINGTEYTASDTLKYIDETVSYDGGAYWPYYNSSREYRWTRTGVHRFFGWLDFDKSYNNGAGLSTASFFGSSPLVDGNPSSASFLTVTTPVYSFQTTSPQYDFCVAKGVTLRDAADKDYSTVPMPMRHLFTAVSLCLRNASSHTNIQITDISTLYQGEDIFPHKGYATIDYSSGNANIAPVYHLEGDLTRPFFNASAISGTTIVPDKAYDLLTGVDVTSGSGETYFMTWPLTKDQISPQDIIGQDIFGDPIYDPHDKVLALTYVANGGNPETVRVQFPYKDWKAGTRIRFLIEFTDKSIQMVSEVLPWDYNVTEMDFNGESLSVPDGGKLGVEGMDVLADNATIHLTTVTPEITCKLFISSLKGATLVINKVGADPSYFTVEPSTMTITGDRMYFVVKPSSLPTGGQTRTMNLSFSVALPSGREIDGDSEILGNDHNYTFSRQ